MEEAEVAECRMEQKLLDKAPENACTELICSEYKTDEHKLVLYLLI